MLGSDRGIYEMFVASPKPPCCSIDPQGGYLCGDLVNEIEKHWSLVKQVAQAGFYFSDLIGENAGHH